MKGNSFKILNNKNELCLIVHGFYANTASMSELAEQLTSQFDIIAPLLPGHNTFPEDLYNFSYIDWVKYIYFIITENKNKYSKIHYIGHSMGGTIGLYLTSQFTNIFDSIITINSPVFMFRYVQYIIKLSAILDLKFSPIKINKSKDEHIEEWTGYKSNIPFFSVQEFLKLTYAAKNFLKKIKLPILIIQSTKDRTVPPLNCDIIYNNVSSKIKYLKKIDSHSHNIVVHRKEKYKIFDECKKFYNELL